MTNIEEESLPTYMVWVTIEGADETPADNGFEYVSDAVNFADVQVEKLRTDKVDNWEVAVYDTFANQNVYVIDSGE
jgi:hypothetical protein